jgi:hypothetical protein
LNHLTPFWFKVRVLSDRDNLDNEGSDIRRFAKHKIAVRLSNGQVKCHHKFAVIDDRLLLTGKNTHTHKSCFFRVFQILIHQPLLSSLYQALSTGPGAAPIFCKRKKEKRERKINLSERKVGGKQ